MATGSQLVEEWKYRFDTHAYYNTFFNCAEADNCYNLYMTDVMKSYHDILKDGIIGGQRCLDFGCGSMIHYSISPSKWFEEIYFADFANNLKDITKWVNRSPDAHDWTYFFEGYASLEGTNAKRVENRVRDSVSGIIPYTKSILDQDVLDPKYKEYFDCILLNHVLQAACTNMAEHVAALKNIMLYVKPRGYIFILDPIGETFSQIGENRFQMYPLVYDEEIRSFREAGLHRITTRKNLIRPKEKVCTDTEFWHLTLLQKVQI